MRGVLTAAVVTVVTGTAAAQFPPPPAEAKPVVRYGVAAVPDYYKQGTAKEALAAAVKALENRRYEYLAAHLLDAAVVDARVADRAAVLEPVVEKELAALRAAQRRNPNAYAVEELLPLTPPEFAERVKAETTDRAFRAVAKSISDTLEESPENVKLLAKFAREGEVAESGTTATVSLKSGTAKKVYLKQDAAGRWVVEDRQSEEAKPKVEAKPKSEK